MSQTNCQLTSRFLANQSALPDDATRLPLRCSRLFESAVMGFMRFIAAAAAGALIVGLLQPQGLIAHAQGKVGGLLIGGGCCQCVSGWAV